MRLLVDVQLERGHKEDLDVVDIGEFLIQGGKSSMTRKDGVKRLVKHTGLEKVILEKVQERKIMEVVNWAF